MRRLIYGFISLCSFGALGLWMHYVLSLPRDDLWPGLLPFTGISMALFSFGAMTYYGAITKGRRSGPKSAKRRKRARQ